MQMRISPAEVTPPLPPEHGAGCSDCSTAAPTQPCCSARMTLLAGVSQQDARAARSSIILIPVTDKGTKDYTFYKHEMQKKYDFIINITKYFRKCLPS